METFEVEELYALVDVGTPVVVLEGSEHDFAIARYWL